MSAPSAPSRVTISPTAQVALLHAAMSARTDAERRARQQEYKRSLRGLLRGVKSVQEGGRAGGLTEGVEVLEQHREQRLRVRRQQLPAVLGQVAEAGKQHLSITNRSATRILFVRPYLAHFCSFFLHFFAVFSVLTPEIQKVAPEDRGSVA